MTIHWRDATGAVVDLKSRTDGAEQVAAHDVASLPGTVENAINATATFLQVIAGMVTAGVAAVDIGATARGYLLTLAGAITAGRMAVDLATTPTANIATLAGAIAAGRMAVDLATTPTANMATLAGAVASGKMQADVATLPAPAAAIFSGQGTVGTTHAALASSQALKHGVWIRNTHATQVLYVGPSAVTAANGYKLNAGEEKFLPVANLATVDTIASGAGTTFCYLAS